MKKRSNKSKEFKLTQDFDDFDEYLGGLVNSDEGIYTDPPNSILEFTAEDGTRLSFLHPQKGHSISTGFVIAHSAETIDFLNADNSYDQEFSQFQPLIALPGDRLAIKDISQIFSDDNLEENLEILEEIKVRKLKNGSKVAINDSGEFIAEQFGFIILFNGTLSIISPLHISQDKLRVDWLLSPDLPGGISRQMIEFWLNEVGITSSPDEKIDDLIRLVQTGSYYPSHYTVVSGTPPENGENGKIEWQIDINLSPGKELPDGKIDFKERNYVVGVTTDQLLGVLKPPTQGIPGLNIFGFPLPAKDGTPLHIENGDNVRAERKEDDILFFAVTDGAFHFDHNTVFITDVLILPEGVNYKTGNINFGGDVVVEGDVESGFSVRAGGDIIVTDSVENGSTLVALGKITVGSFVSGNRVLIAAGQSVLAQYVNEATIKAGEDIILANYSRHAKLRAQRHIQVKKAYGKFGGSVIGGEAWAGQQIDIHIAGAEAWIQTEIVAGISPEQAERFDKIMELIETKNSHIRQILGHFGLVDLDLNKLKSMIENADGVKKKGMALRAKYLVSAGKQLQQLLAEKMEITAEAGPVFEDAKVVIREKAYPNTIVGIGKNRRQIDQIIGPADFFLENDILVSS